MRSTLKSEEDISTFNYAHYEISKCSFFTPHKIQDLHRCQTPYEAKFQITDYFVTFWSSHSKILYYSYFFLHNHFVYIELSKPLKTHCNLIYLIRNYLPILADSIVTMVGLSTVFTLRSRIQYNISAWLINLTFLA